MKALAARLALIWALAALVAGCGAASANVSPQDPTAPAEAAPTAAPAAQPTVGAAGLIAPGDTVGDVVLTTIANPNPAMPAMTDPCNAQNTGEPGVYTFTCSILTSRNLWLGLGWSNPPDQLDADWERLSWRAYLDGQEIDLPAFGTFDINITGSDHRLRGWNVAIAQPVPRLYTLRMVAEVAEGGQQKAGVYDLTYKITVAGKQGD
ncbi:MAG TPA: hypothetical protein PKD53_04635 [Chloroflexaceae bacterium]|nr:hypothetical protein [Chloroflexaceae bacterium]